MKNIFSLKKSKSRMILLFIVDVITIIVDSYLALIVRYKMDGNTVPVEDLASVNTYLLINIVTTMIIFLLLNLYNRVWSYASLYEALLVCVINSISGIWNESALSDSAKKFSFVLFLFLDNDNFDHKIFLSYFACSSKRYLKEHKSSNQYNGDRSRRSR